MTMTMLTTKLYIPPPRLKVVCRPRLLVRLNEGLQHKLTLISAPAGFGKTTLVSEWIAGCSQPSNFEVRAAWLSLDEGDSEPARFLTYLVAALQTVVPQIGERVLEVLHASQPHELPIEPILTDLLNEITPNPGHFVLILDDYHLVDSKLIDQGLTFLLEHMPPQMHLVITTREDPQLPLARLRARGQLTELRASDLRFTPSEALDFINQVMDLNLSTQEIDALETRTEGWIAGLQLAALALQETLSLEGQPGISGFIQAFAGDHRYIVDYLVEEVLQRQPEQVRSFFLQTAILDRLNGPLCDAVTGQEGSSARLEALQRGNFFIVSLDDRRHWYRYHHLFAEVLSVHLAVEQPEQVAGLHRRASEWFEKNGFAADAVRHALAGQDFERAANLVEREAPAMRRSRQEATILAWLRTFPTEIFHNRPVLSGNYGAILLQSGETQGVEDWLRKAERWLDPADRIDPIDPADHADRIDPKDPADPAAAVGEPAQASPIATRPEPGRRMVVVNEAEFRRLPGLIAVHRAGLALTRGEPHITIKYARQALEHVTEEDHLGRGAAAALLGLAYWTGGDLEAAHRSYADGMARLLRAGHYSDVLGCTLALADIRLVQGRLRDAVRTFERGLQLLKERGTPALRGAADMFVGLSELNRERNDLDAAALYLMRSDELGEFAGLPQNRYRWRVAMAGIRKAQDDLDGALDLLQEAEHLYVGDFSPNVRPVAAMKARLWAAQGRLEEALDWAREQGLSAEDDLTYLREFEHITLARILLASCQSGRTNCSILELTGFLERLLKAAEEGGRMGSVIEISLLRALTHHMLGDIRAALPALERALTLAAPEGYARLFLDEGLPLERLLHEANARGIQGQRLLETINKLLAAFGAQRAEGSSLPPFPERQGQSPHASQPLLTPEMPLAAQVQAAQNQLVEPLSQRELEVLRLFRTELSGPEIAQELMVALSTVRTHTKSIYSKINVNSRRAAVKRAVELNLI